MGVLSGVFFEHGESLKAHEEPLCSCHQCLRVGRDGIGLTHSDEKERESAIDMRCVKNREFFIHRSSSQARQGNFYITRGAVVSSVGRLDRGSKCVVEFPVRK